MLKQHLTTGSDIAPREVAGILASTAVEVCMPQEIFQFRLDQENLLYPKVKDLERRQVRCRLLANLEAIVILTIWLITN